MIRKKLFLSRRKILLPSIGLLLLLLLSGSLFFVTHNADGQNTTTIATKTPDAHTPTSDAHSPTPATHTPSPTTTSEPTPQPLFIEDFADHAKGWYLNDRAGYTRTFANGQLILQCTNQKRLIESLPESKTYDNFTITVTFTLQTGDENDSVGLYLRGDSNLDHDYRLDIYGDTTYALSKESLGEDNLPENTPIIEPEHTPALNPMGKPNTLTVTMQGSTITLTINGQQVNTLTDTSYQQGQIALFVNNGTTSGGVTASFSRIAIYGLPPTPPTPQK
jgi:hypothetical protein